MSRSAAAQDREKAREIGRVTAFWAALVAIAAIVLLFYGDVLASLAV
jgi:hypothetical protein